MKWLIGGLIAFALLCIILMSKTANASATRARFGGTPVVPKVQDPRTATGGVGGNQAQQAAQMAAQGLSTTGPIGAAAGKIFMAAAPVIGDANVALLGNEASYELAEEFMQGQSVWGSEKSVFKAASKRFWGIF
jgi:hypothetical protein